MFTQDNLTDLYGMRRQSLDFEFKFKINNLFTKLVEQQSS